jgi:uncharacterized protein (TIGR02118 family)
MIKMSVLYPNGDDATFDMEYYRTAHMDIVERTMKPAKIEIDHGSDGPCIAAGHLYFDSADAMAAGMGGAGEALADVPNFTNVSPVVQTSQIVDR